MIARAAAAAATAVAVAACAAASTPAAPAPRATGIWISQAELQRLPMRGAAWQRLKATADADLGTAEIRDQLSTHDVRTLAVALVYARTGEVSYRRRAADAVAAAIGTETGGRTLALARNLFAYVVAADLVDLTHYDPGIDARFRSWLRDVRHAVLDGRTLVGIHEARPNNWGTHAGASRVAAAVYLGDRADLARAAAVFHGYLGNRAAYARFAFGDLSWQADPARPVGVNPAGAVREGESIDGVLPDDMRRGCEFRFPPCETSYPWEALQGAVAQARVLSRHGYPAWRWEQRALLRAVRFLASLEQRYGGWWAEGDDAWVPWVVNGVYGTRFAQQPVRTLGKNVAFTDWTHAAPARRR